MNPATEEMMDTEFNDYTIDSVEKAEDGWSVGMDSGWHCFVPAPSPIEPEPGRKIRLYGPQFGAIRGIAIDGAQVFYRSPEAQKEHSERELYGADATEWLKRWDEGRSVWTIEMGGLGPGYEQCIHITCAEILRVMLDSKLDHSKWGDKDEWRSQRDLIDKIVMEVPAVKALGLSGAQWGAALNLAAMLYKRGPREVMADERVKDRHIQVSRSFPVAA